MTNQRPILLGGDHVTTLDAYVAGGGGTGLRTALQLGPDGVLDELELSGLRGRGGAGFPVGLKWRSVLSGGDAAGTRFVVVNGAEGEPGTFKDRAILRHNPYRVVEGAIIAAETIGAPRAFIAIKQSFAVERELLARAIAEIDAAGWTANTSVELVTGPDEYLFGEEKALLEVIEGDEPMPRLFPPYLYGLFTTSPQVGWSAGRALSSGHGDASNPTLVNNVETFANVADIVAHGGEWFRSFGTLETPGTIVCTVSGDTVRHGVGEFEMGTPLIDVIEQLGGGLPPGRSLKYVLSGVSNPVMRGHHLDTPLSHEAMEAIGTGLGTGGFIVFDDRTDPAELAAAVSRFLWVESCGQCPPCKLGSQAITETLVAMEGTVEGADFATLSAHLGKVTDAARCFLASQEQRVVSSLVPDMRDPALRCPNRGLLITKLVDLVGDQFVLDDRQALKQPDWTYRSPT
jgi:NADH-quinone oxidoreductase subunit F